MNQQNIVLVDCSFSNLNERKLRPAVIVSNNNYNKKSQDVVICAMTSNLENKLYSIIIDNSNLSNGKLPVKSRIKADKLLQVEKRLILKSFAKLNNKTFDSLIQEILNLVKR